MPLNLLAKRRDGQMGQLNYPRQGLCRRTRGAAMGIVCTQARQALALVCQLLAASRHQHGQDVQGQREGLLGTIGGIGAPSPAACGGDLSSLIDLAAQVKGALALYRDRAAAMGPHRTLCELLFDLEPDQPFDQILFEHDLRCSLQRVCVAIRFFGALVRAQLRPSCLNFVQTSLQGGLGELDKSRDEPPPGPGKGAALHLAGQHYGLFCADGRLQQVGHPASHLIHVMIPSPHDVYGSGVCCPVRAQSPPVAMRLEVAIQQFWYTHRLVLSQQQGISSVRSAVTIDCSVKAYHVFQDLVTI